MNPAEFEHLIYEKHEHRATLTLNRPERINALNERLTREFEAAMLHAEDDDFGQAGTLVRKVFDDAQRRALVEQVSGSLLGGVRSPVLERAFEYWKNIDPGVGKRIEDKVRKGSAAEPAAGMGEA